MKPALFALCALVLTACEPAAAPGEPQATRTAAAPSPAPAPADTDPPQPAAVDLAGYWRVAGIDGEPFDRPYGIALVADAKRIWWEPACAGQGRDYAISGNGFATTRPAGDGQQDVCEIAYPSELSQIWSALDAAERIGRTPANGVQIEGGGRSVTLFSQ